MKMKLLGDLLAHAIQVNGETKTLFQGGRELSYPEAAKRAASLAAGLLRRGIEPGQHIGILSCNCIEYWETYFAAHFSGAVLAPLNTRLTARELEFILRDGQIRALIVGPDFVPLAKSLRNNCDLLEHLVLLGDDSQAGFLRYEALVHESPPLPHPRREWREEDLINLCYTGGTTGLPKGVMLSQRNVVSNARHVAETHSLTRDDIWLHIAPLFHLADAWACYSFPMVAGKQVFAPAFTPQAFLENVQQHGVTSSILVPAMANFVLNFPDLGKYDLSSLRLLLVGGAPMPVDRILAARKLLGPVLCQAYGMTETSPLLTSQRLEWLDYESDEGVRRLASCGRAVDGVRLRLETLEGDEPEPGSCGEIVASGPNVMLGYWNRPDETAAVLREGWMHTGDIAYRDEEGYYFIVDRAKDMIITGGENVFSTEVESVLYEHPAVLEAAVIGIPDDDWGERVHAVIVTREGTSVAECELLEHCREKIASFKCPRSFTFRDEPLPKSGPGKILKSVLRKPFWAEQERRIH